MEGLKCVTLFLMVASALQFSDAQGLGLQGLINISGTVSCSANGSVVVSATTPAPPFQNALVELVCGGNVISSSITNGSGVFNIRLNTQVPLTSLLSSCNVRVATPLSDCNATLPSIGFLQSTLQIVSNLPQGLLNAFYVAPRAFQFTVN